MYDKQGLGRITGDARRWAEGPVAQGLAKFPERQKRFESPSGLEVERLYTPGDVADLDYLRDLGFPGEYPFTRGVQATMYRGRFWTMRQYAGFGSAEETNRRFKYLLERGQTGLSVAFDLPTQLGLDSDHARAEGEVGRTGVAVSTLRDMEVLFDGIPLDRVSTSMTINAPAAVLLAMYAAVAANQGANVAKLEGTIQNDILKEYAARGNYIFPPAPSMRLTTDIFAWCRDNVPNWNTISISGYHIREAGATATQEVAFTLANGIAYVEAARAAGLQVDEFGPRLSFFFNAHMDFLEEIAKFRAARRLWGRIMRERFNSKNPRAQMLRFHTQTAGCTLTAQQPLNNVVRVALQALAAVLGGTQSLHTNSFDEALSLPTEQAVEVALRTQQVVAHESGVTETIDPLGGSYYLENLTGRIEAEAEGYLRRIDEMGGAVAAVEKGFIQAEIHDSAYRYQRDVDQKRRTVVGVNAYQDEQAATVPVLRLDEAAIARQLERLGEVRAARDAARVAAALGRLDAAAAGGGAMMPHIVAAVRAYATLGEICGVLRRVFGEYLPPSGV